MSSSPSCVIVGAGPGNGLAFARRFKAAGYVPVLMARDPSRIATLAKEVDGQAIACDVRDPIAVTRAFAMTHEMVGDPEVLIYNAGAGKWGNVDAVGAEDMESAWRTNALGCVLAVQHVLPGMRRRKRGTIIVIGATASLKGGANFLAFASAKAALRSVAQSLARQLGPEGIHVAHVVIDGVIALERTRAAMPDRPDSFFMQSEHIADAVFHLTEQKPSAWTFELDLRPFGEKW